MIKLAVVLGFMALNFYTYYFLATDAVHPPRTSFAEFPTELENGWKCRELEQMDEATERNLGVTDYLICDFRNEEPPAFVNVYVGYHASQIREEGGGAGENSIHPPAHCLPGSGWDIVQNETVALALPGMPEGATVKRLLIAKGNMRQLVYYWYQSRGRVISQDWQKIVYVGLDRAIRRRTDGSLVRFTVPVVPGPDGEERAEQGFRSLAPLVLSRLPEYVPE